MKLLSLNIALPADFDYAGRQVRTGGYKQSVASAALLADTLAGDGVADLENHGGVSKAVNVYAADHYPYWEGVFGAPLTPAAFSENFTVQGAFETECCIGDRWQVGDAVLEISQPRMPCFKLALKHDKKYLVKWVRETGFTGFYLRVITQGLIHSGAEIEVIHKDPAGLTIAEVNTLYYSRGLLDAAALARVMSVAALSPEAVAVLSHRTQHEIN
jgi:MOSC domain-containing protein YiiM